MKKYLLAVAFIFAFALSASAQDSASVIHVGTLALRPVGGDGFYFVTDAGQQRLSWWDGAAWVDFIQSPPLTCFTATDQTNATVTFANVTGCSIPVVAGVKYTLAGTFYFNESLAANGAKIDFAGGSATASVFRVQCVAFDTALQKALQVTALATVVSAPTLTTTVGDAAFLCSGTFTPSGSGTLIARMAQNTHTSGTLTLRAGSNIVVTQR